MLLGLSLLCSSVIYGVPIRAQVAFEPRKSGDTALEDAEEY